MFTRIGLAVSRHPVVVLAVWALLLTVMTGLAFQGLGAGGLFERLASAEATTPDTDSHVVYSMTRTDGEGGESITVVVSGVDVAGDPGSAAAAASAVRGELAGLDGVASVTDAFTMPDPTSQQARALLSADGDGFVELVELDRELHPYYVGTQAHPELKSRPTRAHPLFAGLIRAGLERRRDLYASHRLDGPRTGEAGNDREQGGRGSEPRSA